MAKRIIRNVYNPPAHLVRQLEDWLEGEAARNPAGVLAQCLALDAAYEDAAAFDARQRAPLRLDEAVENWAAEAQWMADAQSRAEHVEDEADALDAADEASLDHFNRYVAGDR